MIVHPFSSRRHHCRACGKIFCGQHSSNTLFLLNAGNDIQPSSAATPNTSSFPSSSSLSRYGPRRGSMPASGTTTPSLSSASKDQYFPSFEAPTSSGSPSSVNGISSGQIVNARVCDDCHVSALVQASLAGIDLSPPSPSSPIYRTTGSMLGSKSTPVSLQHSPQNSQILPVPSGRGVESNSSSAASSARTRQESAGTQSATSTADSSVDTSSTTPPPLSSNKVSPASADAPISPAAPGIQSRTSSSSTYRTTEERRTIQPARLTFPEYRGETTKIHNRHPLDPAHARLAALGEESGAGSNPDGSLESGLGTPGVGWTWSTWVT